MDDNRFDDVMEIFLDDDSGSEFEGFTLEDIREIGDIGDDSFEQDSDSEHETSGDSENKIPDAYSHPWLIEFSEVAGPVNLPESMSQVDYFFLFFTDEVIDLLVNETNRYAEQVRKNTPTAHRVCMWHDIDRCEMKAFLSLLLLTGLTKRSSYDLYWSTDPLIEMPRFRSVMCRNRINCSETLHKQ